MNAGLWEPFPRRIAVFRALQLGDLLCAVPALRALRAFAPHSVITLVSLPWAESFVRRFHRYVDDLLVFPGYPGHPEHEGTFEDLAAFTRASQARRFDLAIQLHGRGEISNVLLAMMGATRRAGFRPASQAYASEPWFMPWPDSDPEPIRYLKLMEFLGVPPQGTHLEMPLKTEDFDDYASLVARHRLRRGAFVCLHPGARLRSRRWPIERFAAVGTQLAREGWPLVVTGSAAEAELTRKLLDRLPAGTIDLTGQTTLGSLAALISDAALLVCNDTGVSHVAAARGTPSVVVASGSDVARWAPLDDARHRVLWFDVACRPCNFDDCPVGHACALGVSEQVVVDAARRLLDERISHAA